MSISSTMHDSLIQEYAKVPLDKPVSPRLLAEAVIAQLDPPHSADSHAFCWGLGLALCQMARDICRNRFRESEQSAENGALFDFKLQPRYPQARNAEGEDDAYVPLDAMTVADFDYNLARMAKEISAKQFHMDALRQERDARIRSGRIVESATA